jgi:hypothetical protein
MPTSEVVMELTNVFRQLHVGKFQVNLLEDGSLRDLSWNGIELLSSIYAAVRNHNWATVPIQLTFKQVESNEHHCQILFSAEHCQEQVHFRWDGQIELDESGLLVYELKGRAEADFLKNRIGFCLLHPMSMAGKKVQVETKQGLQHSVFPEWITPYDPFVEFRALEFSLSEQERVKMVFEGDWFQTEDQRNWTDGSFKTFCTPLHLPYPVQMVAGDLVNQRIVLQVESYASSQPSSGQREHIRIDWVSCGLLPRLGTTLSYEEGAFSPTIAELHRSIGWSDVRAVLHLENDDWRAKLAQASEAARTLATKLHLECVVPYTPLNWETIGRELHSCASILAGISIYPARLVGAPLPVATTCELSGASWRATQYVTTKPLLEDFLRNLSNQGIQVQLGGGSRANFAEWNRAVLPFEQLDFTEFAINPQVHAGDLLSIIETLPAQGLAVKTAMNRCPQLPVRVSSIMLKPEFNPYASDDEAALQSSHRLGRHDARLTTSFAAGWTIGSIYQLSRAGVAAIRYFEHAGSLGMIDSETLKGHPVYDVFKELSDLREASVLSVEFPWRSIAALALKGEGRIKVMVANLEHSERSIPMDYSAFKSIVKQITIRDLHEGEPRVATAHGNELQLKLSAFAVAIVDFTTTNEGAH